MKPRENGFLDDISISHDGEPFDYIVELHEYLWRFVRVHIPGASGDLGSFVDQAVFIAEGAAALRGQPSREEVIEECRLAYESHTHVAGGLNRDKCQECGHDIRAATHLRVGEYRQDRINALYSSRDVETASAVKNRASKPAEHKAGCPAGGGYGTNDKDCICGVDVGAMGIESYASRDDKPRLPEKVTLPCDCYTGTDGCMCGNYDDARSQGHAQGWNECLDKIASMNARRTE